MDSETLGTLALILLYLAFQFMGGRKKKNTTSPTPPRQRPLPAETADEPEIIWSQDLQDALREIRDALGKGEEARPSEQKPPVPEMKPAAIPPARLEKQAPAARPSEFRPVEVIDKAARLEKDIRQPVIQDAFVPEFKPAEAHLSASLHGDTEHDLPGFASLPAAPPPPSPPSVIRKMQGTDALKEAFVLSELLGPPRSRRRN